MSKTVKTMQLAPTPAQVANQTKFAAESAEQAAQNNAAALVLFSAPEGLNLDPASNKKIVRMNLPQMVTPKEVPIDGCVTGEILRVVDSPVTTIKGKLLWLRHASGKEFLFPCTGVIRNAMAPGRGAEAKELQSILDKHVGKTFVAKRLANKISKQYLKDMFMFDVFLIEK